MLITISSPLGSMWNFESEWRAPAKRKEKVINSLINNSAVEQAIMRERSDSGSAWYSLSTFEGSSREKEEIKKVLPLTESRSSVFAEKRTEKN
jgi:hypothetical protein